MGTSDAIVLDGFLEEETVTSDLHGSTARFRLTVFPTDERTAEMVLPCGVTDPGLALAVIHDLVPGDKPRVTGHLRPMQLLLGQHLTVRGFRALRRARPGRAAVPFAFGALPPRRTLSRWVIHMNAPAGPFPPGPHGLVPTFKLGMVQATAFLLGGFLCGTALAYLLVEVTGGHMTAAELWSCLSAAVVASVVVPALPPHYRVELNDNCLVLRGGGRREIPWRDIIGLEIRKTVGIRTVFVQVSGGRWIPLRAPMSFLDRGFDNKAKVLTDWWGVRRGGPEEV
ncbi:hypothetical protein [Streptomyces microflavus]|uniref:hypothetical protein n=1 Tax=Streptomyces microflavus TaxID=1919 RepID=UPI0036902957